MNYYQVFLKERHKMLSMEEAAKEEPMLTKEGY